MARGVECIPVEGGVVEGVGEVRRYGGEQLLVICIECAALPLVDEL